MSTVFIGLSGGVDSAVSAALLQEQGYNVVGAFIKIWRPEFIDCPWQRDRLDAMRVCAALEIPFKEIDLSEEYKKTVIDDTVANYAHGITPNPDVLCNRHIKFGTFAQWAFSEGADLLATGHYAQIQGDALNSPRRRLARGKDVNKDQSYFLWQLTRKDLDRILFPVGHLTKPEVRTLAEKFNLPVAKKKDSQGLCFVGDLRLRDFLSHYLPLKKGKVLDGTGAVIGEHDGAALYTLGERHGFRTATHSTRDAPHYVIAVDTKENTIIVSTDLSKAQRSSTKLISVNRIEKTARRKQYTTQTRYREEPVSCMIEDDIVTFEKPHLVSPGQSLVIYDGEKLLGGGIITAAPR